MNGFSIDLSAPTWAAGRYTVSVDADGASTRCEVTLPLKPCDAGASVSCDGDGVSIGESGCALPPAQHSLSGLTFSTEPKQLSVRIEHEGALIGEASFTPEYIESRPNGPDCEPVCRGARAEMKLSAPTSASAAE